MIEQYFYENNMSSRKRQNSVGTLCYICGNFIISKQKQKITDFVESAYNAHFGFEIQFKSWTPQLVCTIYIEQLRQ